MQKTIIFSNIENLKLDNKYLIFIIFINLKYVIKLKKDTKLVIFVSSLNSSICKNFFYLQTVY